MPHAVAIQVFSSRKPLVNDDMWSTCGICIKYGLCDNFHKPYRSENGTVVSCGLEELCFTNICRKRKVKHKIESLNVLVAGPKEIGF